MNTALYPGTLGYYFDTLLQPVVDEPSQDVLRDFFLRNVTGRGPLPAIRVGDQPYGVLLTSDFSKWQWSKLEVMVHRGFLTTLQSVLEKYQGIWSGILGKLRHISEAGPPSDLSDPSGVLLNILGLQAGSVSFY